MEYDDCLKQLQSYLENNPLVILGSGASADYGLPMMSDLTTDIKAHSSEFTEDEFSAFCDNLKTYSLEKAIDKTDLSDASRETIRDIVWNSINKHDKEFFSRLLSDKTNFAIADLLKKIIATAPNTAVIVTTNYDRIAEYAADILGATAITGFEGCLIKKLELPIANVRNKRIRARERTVEIWKVHGSLDWFIDAAGNIASYPLSNTIPDKHKPLIIPPGKDKYGATHGEPYRDIITQVDAAFSRAGSYMCIGYGFNDEHIQPKLIEQIKGGKPIVVLCKSATDACKRYVSGIEVQKFVILECSSDGKTAVTGNSYHEEYNGNFWKLPDFIKTVWG